VAHSYNGFPVSTGEEFLAFARALAASGPGAPTPTPIDTFMASHPQTRWFLETPKPVPASFATEPYYGVNAFRFTNQDGTSRHGRYWMLPVGGVAHLNPADAAARPAGFLFDELVERLSRGPVEFRLVVQLAADGDPVHDGSLTWPMDRPQVELGTLSVTARSQTARQLSASSFSTRSGSSMASSCRAVGARPRGQGGGTRAIHPGRARHGGPATLHPASARGPRRSAPHPRWCSGAREMGGS